MCGRRVSLVGGSRCVFTVLACAWMLSVLSVACRVCLALPVCVARKGRRGRLVLMVQLGWLALWVRRVLRV